MSTIKEFRNGALVEVTSVSMSGEWVTAQYVRTQPYPDGITRHVIAIDDEVFAVDDAEIREVTS